MAQNISRNTFDPRNNYDRVVFNQKRSLLDAELNESQDILAEFSSLLSRNGIGDGPVGDSYLVKALPGPNQISVRSGIFYHQGNLVRTFSDIIIANLTTPTAGNRTDTVYIHYQLISVDSTDDSTIVDPNIGLETATRRQVQVDVKVAEGVALPTVNQEDEFIIPIAQINRINSDPQINQGMLVDWRNRASRNYVEEGILFTTTQPNIVSWSAGTGIVGDQKFSVSAGSSTVPPSGLKRWFVDSFGNLTYGNVWPSEFHVKIAETYVDQNTGLFLARDLRRFLPVAGLPVKFPLSSLSADAIGTQVNIDSGSIYINGTDLVLYPGSSINLGTGGSHQLSALTANYFRKVLVSLKTTGAIPADQVVITEGPEQATKPDDNTGNPDFPDDQIPVVLITVQDDGQGNPGTIKAINNNDVKDVRPFLNLGSSPEVVEARGNRSSLDERISTSLTEQGILKPGASIIDALNDLRAEPTLGQDPSYPTESMRVYVNPGVYNFGNFSQTFPGEVSPVFTNPSTNTHRLDLLALDQNGDLTIFQGSEVSTATLPSAPSHLNRFPLAEVYIRDTTSKIEENKTSVNSITSVTASTFRIADNDNLIQNSGDFEDYFLTFISGTLRGRSFRIENTSSNMVDYGFTISGSDLDSQISVEDEFLVTQIKRVRPIQAVGAYSTVSPQRHLFVVSGGSPLYVSGSVTLGPPGIVLDPTNGYEITLPFKYLTGGFELQVYRNGQKLIYNQDYEEIVNPSNLKSDEVRILRTPTTTQLVDGDRLEFVVVAGATADFPPGVNPPRRQAFIATPGQTDFILNFEYVRGQSSNSYLQQLHVYVTDSTKDAQKAFRIDGSTASLSLPTGTITYEETADNKTVRFASGTFAGGELVEFVVAAGSLVDNLDLSSNWDNLGTRLRPKQNQGIELDNPNPSVPDIKGTLGTWEISNSGDATFDTINGKDPANILTNAQFLGLTNGGAADFLHTHAGLASGGRVFNSPPNFDSDWVNLANSGSTPNVIDLTDNITYTVDQLGLDPQDWIIMLEVDDNSSPTTPGTNISNVSIGQDDDGSSVAGVYYRVIDKDTIHVFKGAGSTNDYARLRIWDYSKGPASTDSKRSLVLSYETSWTPINAGQQITLTHDLGANATKNAVVVLEGSQDSLGTDPHISNLGINERSNGNVLGARWFGFNSSNIAVERGSDDNLASLSSQWNYFRLRIYTYEFISTAPTGGQLGLGKPNFETPWLSKTTQFINYKSTDPSNSLGPDPEKYLIEILLRDTVGSSGIHKRGVSGDKDQVGNILYPYVTNIEPTRLRIVAAPDDGTILYDQIKIRIWDHSRGIATPDSTEALALKADSQWQTISKGQTVTFTHNVGDDPDDYVVYLTYRNSLGDTSSRYLYAENTNSGQNKGIYWFDNLTNSIKIKRELDDDDAEQYRLKIFKLEQIATTLPGGKFSTIQLKDFFSSGAVTPSRTLIGNPPAITPVWDFDRTAQDELNWVFSVPDDANLNYPLTLNIHWTSDNNVDPGTIDLDFVAKISSLGESVSSGGSSVITSIQLQGNSLLNPFNHAIDSTIEIPDNLLFNTNDLVACRLKINNSSSYIDKFYVTNLTFTYQKFE